MNNAHALCMTVAPRQNLACLLLSRTWALNDGKERHDQMMTHSMLASHPPAFVPKAEPKLSISVFDVIHSVMCPGLVYNGLLKTKLEVSLGDQP